MWQTGLESGNLMALIYYTLASRAHQYVDSQMQCSMYRFRWQKIQREFIKVEEEVARLQEFRGLDEFAVIYQPWSTNISVIILSMCFLFFYASSVNCITLWSVQVYKKDRHCSITQSISRLQLNVNGKRDLTLLSVDCFHLSQKGNAWAGTALWNNLLEPPAQKSLNWMNPLKKFNCPSKQHPFILTYDNS